MGKEGNGTIQSLSEGGVSENNTLFNWIDNKKSIMGDESGIATHILYPCIWEVEKNRSL